jgi:adenine-specific DNA-methyltransferase
MAKRAKTGKKKAPGKADVETYKHKEAKRKNIPTAENQKLIADDDKAVKKLRWPRNPDLDPQLVWRGKDAESDPLEVDAPPIYIQEKIKPQAIIEDLRRQSKERSKDAASQFDFFHDFNGLPEGWKEDATQSYYHDDGNWSNRMILGDSLLVMASLAEREGLRGKVQCIYMDPPYGIRFNSNWQPTTKSHDVKEGRRESVTREPEVIRAFRDTWRDEVHSYLEYLRDRLVAARELLADGGSIFLQIGNENVHLVRSALDEVFRPKNYVAQIAFVKTTGQTDAALGSTFDYIVWYAKNRDAVKIRKIFEDRPPFENPTERYICVETVDGQIIDLSVAQKEGRAPIPQGRILKLIDPSSQTGSEESRKPFEFQKQSFTPSGSRGWSTSPEGRDRVARANYFHIQGKSLWWKSYRDVFPYRPKIIFGWIRAQTRSVTSEFTSCRPVHA